MARDEYPLIYTGPKALDFRDQKTKDELERKTQEAALKKLSEKAIEPIASPSPTPVDSDVKKQAEYETKDRDMRRRYFRSVFMRLQDEANKRKLSEQEQEIARTVFTNWQNIEDEIKKDAQLGRELSLKENK